MRRRLIDAAFQAHADSIANADRVARQLFRDLGAAPLHRVTHLRQAIDRQHADSRALSQAIAVFASAMDLRTGDVLTSAVAFCDRTSVALARLTQLYLGEATIRLASNVTHGEDFLGFEYRRIVSLPYLAELEELAASHAEAAADNLRQIERALGRRKRRFAEARQQAAQSVNDFCQSVRHFAAQLQPADPDSTEYRGRDTGARGSRSLDQLIARFDRAPGR